MHKIPQSFFIRKDTLSYKYKSNFECLNEVPGLMTFNKDVYPANYCSQPFTNSSTVILFNIRRN